MFTKTHTGLLFASLLALPLVTQAVSITTSSGSGPDYSTGATIWRDAGTNNLPPNLMQVLDAEIPGANQSDIFDITNVISVGGVPSGLYGPTTGTYSDTSGDFIDDTILGDVVTLNGFDTQVEFYFDPNNDLLRTLVTLTNNSGSVQSNAVRFQSNSGSNGAYSIQNSESGDTTLGLDDQWVTLDDPDPLSNTAAVFYAFHGTGAPDTQDAVSTTTDFPLNGTDGVKVDFNISLNDGETASLLFFTGARSSYAGALADVTALGGIFLDTGDNHFAGLSQAQLDTIVNYTSPPSAPTPNTLALLLLGLLVLHLRLQGRAQTLQLF